MGRGDIDVRLSQIAVDDHPKGGCGVRHVYERLALDISRADRVACGETVIARQNGEERLTGQMFERQIGHLRLAPKKGDVDPAPEEGAREFRRCLTDEDHLDAW